MSQLVLLYLASLMFRSLCVGLLALVATVFIRSVARRHAVWVAVLVIMLAMPVVDSVLPPSLVPSTVSRVASEPAPVAYFFDNSFGSALPQISSTPFYAPVRTFPIGVWQVGFILYVFVTTTLLLRLGWAYLKLSKLKASGTQVGTDSLNELEVGKVPILYESDSVHVPLTAGFKRPFIFLPADWSAWNEWKLRAVLLHECTHIRRRDFAINTLASINACVFWFNPLAWWIRREIASLAEKACDEASVLKTGDPARYAEVLLQFVVAVRSAGRLRIGGVAMAKQQMQSRIERVLAIKRPGNGILPKAGWVAVLVLTIPLLYAMSAVHIAAQTPAQAPVSPFVAWLERVRSIITVEERVAYQGLQTDAERQRFIEQFWSRRFPSWLDEVAHIIRDEERAAYQSLQTDEERRQFAEQFWLRMDPSPGTTANEFKDDYYRRLEQASRAFAQPSGPEWWKTDRGRIYILYGQPDEMKSYPAGTLHIPSDNPQSVPNPAERWRYQHIQGLGDNVIFNFVDSGGTGDFLLFVPAARPAALGNSPSPNPNRRTSSESPLLTRMSQAPSTARPSFESASINATADGDPRFTGSVRPLPDGRLVAEGVRPRFLIQTAYGLRRYQVLGGPDWMDSAGYDIDARMKAGESANREQMLLRVQSLLEDRFKLRFHRQTQFLPAYVLSVADGGHKLMPAQEVNCLTSPIAPSLPPSPSPAPPTPGAGFMAPSAPVPPVLPTAPDQPLIAPCGRAIVSINESGVRLAAGKASMTTFVATLSNMLGRTVIDKTGFTDTFDAHVRFVADGSLAGLPSRPFRDITAPDGAPTIFNAIEEQLGLKLEPGTAPVEVLVLDHIERPTGN